MVLTFRIHAMASPLRALFESSTTHTVHSVFENTVNLERGGDLVALTHRFSPLSPMGIALNLTKETLQAIGFRVGDQVTLSPQGIKVRDTLLTLDHIRLVDLTIQPFAQGAHAPKITALKSSLHTWLQSSEAKGDLASAWQILNDKPRHQDKSGDNPYSPHLSTLENPLSHTDFANALKPLIGLGEGLTPSGDDFITGLFAAFHAMRRTPFIQNRLNTMNEYLPDAFTRTTDISQAYLTYAQQGMFNIHVKDLLTTEHPAHHDKHIQEISKLGHSSGTDFIVGLYTGIKIGGNNHDS